MTIAALDRLFDDKIHTVLAAKLPPGAVRTCHVDRYSLDRDDGVVTQVLATTSRYATDPDVARYRQLDPADPALWDPASPCALAEALARLAGAGQPGASRCAWVRGKDVHPNCTHNDVVAAVVLIGSTLFVRATTSAVKRAIKRADGPDENAYTVLLVQLIRHYSPECIRFDSDPSRASRDGFSGASLLDACIGRGTTLQFGDGLAWNPQDAAHEAMLRMTLSQGSADDQARRHRLTGKRIAKLKSGGVPFSERQMPHGYRCARDGDGTVRVEAGKGRVPEADQAFVPVLQDLVRMHARGDSYVAIGLRMAALGVPRRGQKRRQLRSYRELADAGDFHALALAAKSFFVNAAASPTKQPDLLLQKLRLWRTGEYLTHVNNDIRGRNKKIFDMTPVYRDDSDEYGYFVITATWPWPVDPETGKDIEAWGVRAELELSEQRIISEIGEPRKTGGAAHHRLERRALRFNEWTDGGTVHSVQPRQYNSGQASCVIFANSAAARGGRRGWSIERANPRIFARATFPLTSLCASVADEVQRASAELIEHQAVAQVRPRRDTVGLPRDEQARALASLEEARARSLSRHQELHDEWEAHAHLAELRMSKGDEQGASRARSRADELAAELGELKAGISDSEVRIAELRQTNDGTPGAVEEMPADLDAAAFTVVALRRAAANNGMCRAVVAEIIDETISGWSMTYAGDAVRWAAQLRLPLASGDTAEVPIEGVISNVRSVKGGRAAAGGRVLAEQVLREHRQLGTVAATSGVATSRRALIVQNLMPWLRKHGVTARGATCALLDHPVPEVQELLFGHLVGEGSRVDGLWSPLLREHVVDVYRNPDLHWGFAAVPHDTIAIQRIVTALAAAGPAGLDAKALALATGLRVRQIIALARDDTATRVRFAARHEGTTGRLVALSCPHCASPGAVADRVALLPEVAVSGYGVLCRCGRPPVDAPATRWHAFAFPPQYTGQLYTRIRKTSLRDEPQTAAVEGPAPLPL